MQATDAAAPPADGATRRTAAFERTQALAIGAAVFLSGAALLGVEIAASRVVAPYFGNSLFVWGALIGVVLTGLSVGYWIGGAVADRLPALLAARLADGSGQLLPRLGKKEREAIAAFYALGGYKPLWVNDGAWTPAAVALRERLEHQTSNAGPSENGFCQHRAADQLPRLQAGQGHHRQ